MSETIDQTFITALLLTASLGRAESAVLDGIQRLDPDHATSDALLRGAVKASIPASPEVPEQRAEEFEQASAFLPLELQHVLRLSRELRHCFVLRRLVGLSREVCAWLLDLDIRRIEQRTCTAMRELAAVEQQSAASA